ncbi:MAG TPA: hypothetical protein VFH73_10750 [Polyangia bacterium]|nr:hypothetical protein [Polyangia bacterium]
MLSTRLADCLVRDRVLPMETVRASLGRQLIYGGGLDTVLLEMGAIDEATLWGALSASCGLPVPDPALLENADPGLAAVFDVGRWRTCRAVPVGRHDDRLQLLCTAPPLDHELRAAGNALGFELELFVAPEVRVRVAAQSVYGEPVPARFLRLLARLLGPEPVRRWAEAHAPAPAPETPSPMPLHPTPPAPAQMTQMTAMANGAEAPRAPARGREPAQRMPRIRRPTPVRPPVVTAESDDQAPLQHVLASSSALMRATESLMTPAEIAAAVRTPTPLPIGLGEDGTAKEDVSQEEKLCRIVDHPRTDVRMAALKALRARFDHPRVQALAAKLRGDADSPIPERALRAVVALAELRDGSAVPNLIRHLKDSNSALEQAAHKGLVEIARQDFGSSRRRWTAWWDRHHDEHRVDWLFEGLSHKTAAIRAAACDELRVLTGEYFGYHFDLPKRERDEARERWETWWTQTGRQQHPSPSGNGSAGKLSPAPAPASSGEDAG